MARAWVLGALVSAVPLLAACGSGRYYVMDPPARAFSEFGSVEVRPLSIDGLVGLPADRRFHAGEVADYITEELRDRLAPAYFPGGGTKIVVSGKLTGFVPKTQDAGVVSAEVLAEITFDLEGGSHLCRILGRGIVFGRIFGDIESAGTRLAEAIVDFVAKNHASVVDRERDPGLKGP